jgi:hypothetical protein
LYAYGEDLVCLSDNPAGDDDEIPVRGIATGWSIKDRKGKNPCHGGLVFFPGKTDVLDFKKEIV